MVSLGGSDLTGNSRWRLVDRLIAGYGLLVAVTAVTRWEQQGVGWVLAAHLALPVLAWLVTRASEGGFGMVLRSAYPVVLLAGLYSAIDVLNGFGTAMVFDPPIQALEKAVTGGQPARDWWRSSPSSFWSTIFHAVYFSYYIIVPLPVIVLLATGRSRAITAYLDGVIATFLTCYLIYLWWPVAGPYYEFARPTGEFVANGPARLVYGTLAKASSFGAAFPSSHVAATVAAAAGAWRALPRLGMLLSVPTALLTVGVVYTQMHYVIDSVAGVIVGLLIPAIVARYALRRSLV